MIDWTDPGSLITLNFTVQHAIWLPEWKRLATEAEGLDQDAKDALVSLCRTLEQVRILMGCELSILNDDPLQAHCMYRPHAYNALPTIGGAVHSAHIARIDRTEPNHPNLIAAVDFHPAIPGVPKREACRQMRDVLIPVLEAMDLRMENNGPHAPWIHLDSKWVPKGGHRYFVP